MRWRSEGEDASRRLVRVRTSNRNPQFGLAGGNLQARNPRSKILARPRARDHGCAALSFAHGAAETLRLPESRPALARIGFLDHRAPEEQDVDPGIAAVGGGIPGQPDGGALGAPPPRPKPRRAAFFELCDDCLCHLLMEAHAIVSSGHGLHPPLGRRFAPQGRGRRSGPEPRASTHRRGRCGKKEEQSAAQLRSV